VATLEHTTLQFKRQEVIVSTIPPGQPISAAEPGGEAESELFTQGGDFKGLFVTSLHACSYSGPPPDLAFDFRIHYIILKVGVRPSLSNAVFHSASLQPCRYYWPVLFSYSSLFHLAFLSF
jgi:hypothetical protein